MLFKDILQASDNFKKSKKVYEVMFFDMVKVCIFWKCVQYNVKKNV